MWLAEKTMCGLQRRYQNVIKIFDETAFKLYNLHSNVTEL